jgi:hypothetical protein
MSRPLIRVAVDDDAEELSRFSCSTGEPYEDEVEAFIRDKALKRVESGSTTPYKLLVVEEAGRLIACGGYHGEPLFPMVDETAMQTTRLQLLAVALDQRGRRLDDGVRLADFIFESVVLDAFEAEGGGVLTTLVARENGRSITVCERNGLRTQTPYDSKFVRLTGTFVIR